MQISVNTLKEWLANIPDDLPIWINITENNSIYSTQFKRVSIEKEFEAGAYGTVPYRVVFHCEMKQF